MIEDHLVGLPVGLPVDHHPEVEERRVIPRTADVEATVVLLVGHHHPVVAGERRVVVDLVVTVDAKVTIVAEDLPVDHRLPEAEERNDPNHLRRLYRKRKRVVNAVGHLPDNNYDSNEKSRA